MLLTPGPGRLSSEELRLERGSLREDFVFCFVGLAFDLLLEGVALLRFVDDFLSDEGGASKYLSAILYLYMENKMMKFMIQI